MPSYAKKPKALVSALIVGGVLGSAQIVFDAYLTRQAVDADAKRILNMFRDPSTQALYSLDSEMAMQVIEGLFQDNSVRQASIGHPNEAKLAEKNRPLQETSSRWLTDLILGKERSFTTPLVSTGTAKEYYGDLSITLDTATYGQSFLTNASALLLSGVLRALLMSLVLYLIYHWLLTKPLSNMIQHLAHINPDHPSEHLIPQLKGHEGNELGVWVNTANQLLASIERNAQLRQEAESFGFGIDRGRGTGQRANSVRCLSHAPSGRRRCKAHPEHVSRSIHSSAVQPGQRNGDAGH